MCFTLALSKKANGLNPKLAKFSEKRQCRQFYGVRQPLHVTYLTASIGCVPRCGLF